MSAADLKSTLHALEALERGPRRYTTCDVCGQRPGVRATTTCGIETVVCGPCGGDDERDRELRDRLRREHQDEAREDRRPWNEAEADRVGIPAYGPID